MERIKTIKRFLGATFNLLSDPRKAQYVIVGLAIALVFSLGFSVSQQEDINALKQHNAKQDERDKQLAQAKFQACKASKPLSVKLIGGLAEYFNNQSIVARKVLDKTDFNSILWKPRSDTLNNDLILYNVLEGLLPIKCSKST